MSVGDDPWANFEAMSLFFCLDRQARELPSFSLCHGKMWL